jgi:hypothetical protein
MVADKRHFVRIHGLTGRVYMLPQRVGRHSAICTKLNRRYEVQHTTVKMCTESVKLTSAVNSITLCEVGDPYLAHRTHIPAAATESRDTLHYDSDKSPHPPHAATLFSAKRPPTSNTPHSSGLLHPRCLIHSVVRPDSRESAVPYTDVQKSQSTECKNTTQVQPYLLEQLLTLARGLRMRVVAVLAQLRALCGAEVVPWPVLLALGFGSGQQHLVDVELHDATR